MKKSYPIREKKTYEFRSPNGLKHIEVSTVTSYMEIEIPDDTDPHIIEHPALISETIYEGKGQVLIQMPQQSVPHPIHFNIEADSLEDAFEKYDDCAAEAIKELEEDFQEQINKEQNSIITPGHPGGIIV